MDDHPTYQLRDSNQSQGTIQDLFRIPDRYLRSVHLERDFHDAALLEQYILTPPMERAFLRIAEGIRPNSGRRAWRITGDYGSGKSSFALVLAHALSNPAQPGVAAARRVIDQGYPNSFQQQFIPILVTGAREGLVPAVARGISWALDLLRDRNTDTSRVTAQQQRALGITESGDPRDLLDLISDLASNPGSSGLLLVLDELGKFLEYAALYPDREDVYILQRLAEMAARSGVKPIILVGLLHQGFHAYAERLPTAARHEWEKIAGRFDEIVFDQPLTHTMTLVSSALNVLTDRLPLAIASKADTVVRATRATGWYGAATVSLGEVDPLKIYPLHPTILPVLINFFSRFGQHERSLFSFLLSSEPFGLQAYAERPITLKSWYRLPDFYDYIRANFGHRLSGASFRSQWLRIVDILDGADTNDDVELSVLKSVAVLNLIDAEQLLATDQALMAAICDEDPIHWVQQVIVALKERGLLHKRGAAGGYRLWPNTSINIEARFEDAKRTLGPVDQVAVHLRPYLDVQSLLARRHYIETGTLRHFDVRYADMASLRDAATRPTGADGLIVVALCDTKSDQIEATGYAQSEEAAAHPELLIAVPFPLIGLAREVQDARCWEWVQPNTPELMEDSYASAEVSREVASSRRVLMNRLTSLISFGKGDADMEIVWWRNGTTLEVPQGRGVLPILSDVCDELYQCAPQIRNELLNRSVLSSAASAARSRLIEYMLTAVHEPILGMDPDKAPPEKSMYLSVLKAGTVHRQVDGRYVLEEPAPENDPLQLRPALAEIVNMLEDAKEQRVSVPKLITALHSRPFGVRDGVIPILLAVVVVVHSHELAVYENGTFVARLLPSHFLRLIKAPGTFEFQLVRVAGVRLDLFNQLAEVFADSRPLDRGIEVLDIVRSLSKFAAELPEYTLRSSDLSPLAARVRDVLIKAREPKPLLFRDLPQACGFEAFSAQESHDAQRVQRFIATLQQALDDLRSAYPLLLKRIGLGITAGLGEDQATLDRGHIADRAAKVVVAASESRLRTFALRLADTKLNTDAWADALASFVIAKPTRNWLPGDEHRAAEEIDALCSTFRRLEAITFSSHDDLASSSAVRVGLTHSNGSEAMQVVHVRPEHESEIQSRVSELQTLLPESEELRVAILVRLLDQALGKAYPENPSANSRPQAHTDVNRGQGS